ncbi:MAG: DUF885 domain-containing protein [Burkholderiaceae bacterium]
MLNRRQWLGRSAAAAATTGAWPAARAVAADDPNAAFADLAARYFADQMELDPLRGSATLADPKYEGRLSLGITPDDLARARALNERVARELAALPAAGLGPAERLSHELLGWQVQDALEGDRFPWQLMPIDQWGGLPVALGNLARGDQTQPLKTPTDYDNYLQRLLRLPEYNAQAIANMREGIARGVTMPRPLIVSALPALQNLAQPRLEKTAFGQALQAMPKGFSAADKARIAQAYHRAYADRLRPSMLALLAFLRGPYLAACRSSASLAALPDGEAWYAWQVRSHTTTGMTPEQIHALGLSEVARIRDEITALQAGFGFKGSVTAFLRWHEAQPRFRPYRSWDQVLQGYEALNRQVVPQLPRLFGHVPTQPLAIRLIPELQRATTSPNYAAPAPDGSRPGIFFVGAPTVPAKYNNAGMTSLLLHEGQPGHHFHTCIQQGLALPDFRRYGWFDAFGEGWALYAETLGHEMGLYDDPTQHLGHLEAELHRAVRLVTDTGLHAKGWSREATMRYMMDTEGVSEADARLSTERYMAWPGQALAYKIGQLKISELRQQSQRALGTGFALSRYHDLVLSQGSLPLQVLQRQVEAWVAAGGPAPA